MTSMVHVVLVYQREQARLLLQESFPSWLFQVKNGATTMWERWDGWTPEKGFQTIEMNSFNHYAFGAVADGKTKNTAAIRKAIVPANHANAVADAIKTALSSIVVGDPRLEQVRMGPLAGLAQRREVLGRIAELRRETDLITGEGELVLLGVRRRAVE